ncbi:snare associated Golgi protein-domain-containing protein [Trametes maxima]|nr:snare associated Golgi protein-domain-containing protein [Trametes maxima]
MSSSRYDAYPPNSFQSSDPNHNKNDAQVDVRYLNRTPSPTPSEAQVLSGEKKKRKGFLFGLLDPEKLKDPKELIRTLITIAVLVLVILFIVYQNKIVEWMRPFADWMRRTPGGWLIPIAIMIVLSFPPLFGHEIIAILCGDVWGVWIGFGIVAAGTLLGELINFWVFRWFCMVRGKKWEEKNLQYGLLAEVVREGGFVIAVVIRFSAIPGHLTTTVFATCGMNIFNFLGAAILSLPKQLATVYLGSAQSNGTENHTTKTIKTVVIIVTIAVTIFAMHYVKVQTDKIKERVIYRRRKARQAKLLAAAGMEPTDPEAGFDTARSPLLSSHPAVSTVELDGVRLHVPAPQAAPASGYAPPPTYNAQQQQLYEPPAGPPPGASAWRPEDYTVSTPRPGYPSRARSTSRSPQPSPAQVPYGFRG